MNKEPTHKVVITATSYKDEPNVHMEVSYGPLTEDLGDGEYIPACYEFVQRALIAAAEESEGEFEISALDLETDRRLN